MLRIGLTGIAAIIVLLVVAPGWPIILLAGLSPVLVITFGALQNYRCSPLRPFPDLCAFLGALFVIASELYFRFTSITEWEHVAPSGAPLGGWAVWWGLSLLCGIAAAVVFQGGLGGWLQTALVYTSLSVTTFYASIEIANVRLDQQAPLSVDTAIIVGRELRSNAKANIGVFSLSVPAGSRAPTEKAINSSAYSDFQIGDAVCFTHHAGAFAMPWTKFGLCPNFERVPAPD